MRKSTNAHALSVAFTGLQILDKNHILRKETLDAVKNVLKEYKANGGGNEYDAIDKIKPSDK
jgi:hypothetical protein